MHPRETKKLSINHGFFQENKSKGLNVPLANNGNGIVTYLKQIKKLGILPETQVDNILILLRDDKFDYFGCSYPYIIKELKELGLLKNAEILQIIRLHPGQDGISGYPKGVPYFITGFWNVVSSKEFCKSLGGDWQKSFQESMLVGYSADTSENRELMEFAKTLLALENDTIDRNKRGLFSLSEIASRIFDDAIDDTLIESINFYLNNKSEDHQGKWLRRVAKTFIESAQVKNYLSGVDVSDNEMTNSAFGRKRLSKYI